MLLHRFYQSDHSSKPDRKFDFEKRSEMKDFFFQKVKYNTAFFILHVFCLTGQSSLSPFLLLTHQKEMTPYYILINSQVLSEGGSRNFFQGRGPNFLSIRPIFLLGFDTLFSHANKIKFSEFNEGFGPPYNHSRSPWIRQ